MASVRRRRTGEPSAWTSGECELAREEGLLTLLDTLRWRWPLIVLIAGSLLAGAAFSAETLPSEYEGTAVTSFSPRPDVDPENVRLLLPKYVAYVTAPATLLNVAPRVGESARDLEDAVEATIATDTGNLTITATMPSPKRAARVANALAEEAVELSNRDDLIDGEIVARALPPASPSGPPRRLLEAAALAIGLIVGTALAFILERSRPRLRSWREMARASGHTVIGRIPASRVLKGRPLQASSNRTVGPAFRSLRTNLEQLRQERGLRTVLITSPTKGEGKTTVAALVAQSLARLGIKVLLVDADLRQPAVARLFGINASPGLAEVLRGDASLDDATRDFRLTRMPPDPHERTQHWTHNLSVVPTDRDPDAGDLLARRFADFVKEAQSSFDMIVVDTTPLLGADDARTLATIVDGILLVVSARSMADPVNEAVVSLETLKAPVVGVVGNRLPESRAYAYYG